jgi:hypothetical protein
MPTIRTPLLMPPPSTRLSAIQHRLSIYRHYVISWARLNRQTLLLITKLTIFLAKMLSITKPCLPVAARQDVWYPLMTIAALELALGAKITWRTMGFLGAIHLAAILWAVKLGGGLCVDRRLSGDWGWYD